MKIKLILFLVFALSSNFAHAQFIGRHLQQAANACQPRLYTQLDFFKISSGALKNDSSSAKSVICSVDAEFGSPFYDTFTEPVSLPAWISYQTNGEKLSCTMYMRRKGNGALIDSFTKNLPGGSHASREIGRVSSRDAQGVRFIFSEVYFYIQCKLPAGARIFSIDTGVESRL